MSKFLGSDKIDLTNPDELSSRATDEKETRRKFLQVAKWAGREKDMLVLFAKFDKLQREANTPEKVRDIAKFGATEVYKLLGECFSSLKNSGSLVIPGLDSHRGELWVDGELVYKDK
jgi:GTP-binding protein EngB required for normal cell division